MYDASSSFPGVQKPLDQYGSGSPTTNGTADAGDDDDDFELFGSDDVRGDLSPHEQLYPNPTTTQDDEEELQKMKEKRAAEEEAKKKTSQSLL